MQARYKREKLEGLKLERFENEILSDLHLIKNQEKPTDEAETDYLPPSSRSAKSLPWLVDEEGKILDYTKPLKLFNGVKIISCFLESRSKMDPNLISNAKLTEILEFFNTNNTVSVLELYNHVSKIYKEDESSFSKQLTSETDKFSDNLLTVESNTTKPFYPYGEITFNQLCFAQKENIPDINWGFVYNLTKLTVHGLPVAVNVIGYSIMIITYMKYVHNRPIDKGLSPKQMENTKIMRNRQLGLFCLIGAPITMFLLISSSIPLKNMFTLTIGEDSQAAKNNYTTVNSIIFLSYLNNKIPSWLKISFKILFVTIIVLKIFGFSFGSVFLYVLSINVYYIKVAYYTIFSLRICYNLLNLYLLHKFSNKNIKISEVLPEYLIKRLKEIEIMSKTKPGIAEFKSTCYLDINIYLILMSITIIITYLF